MSTEVGNMGDTINDESRNKRRVIGSSGGQETIGSSQGTTVGKKRKS